jgi:S1-C subfamily serine protease
MADSRIVDISRELADLVSRVAPAVVQVHARSWRPATACVWGTDLVLLADHALERDTGVVVTQGDRRLDAEIAGREPALDLALLRVPGLGGERPVIAGETPRPGEMVLAISRGASGAIVASGGLVSAVATGRRSPLVYTSAPAYPGVSGGVLVDPSGKLIGIATAAPRQPNVVAHPIAVVVDAAAALAEHGRIRRGYLGIATQPVRVPEWQRAAGASDRGLLIVGVGEETPAGRAGVMVGDILTTLDDRGLEDPQDLAAAVSGLAGRSIALGLRRGGAPVTLTVTVGERSRS